MFSGPAGIWTAGPTFPRAAPWSSQPSQSLRSQQQTQSQPWSPSARYAAPCTPAPCADPISDAIFSPTATITEFLHPFVFTSHCHQQALFQLCRAVPETNQNSITGVIADGVPNKGHSSFNSRATCHLSTKRPRHENKQHDQN